MFHWSFDVIVPNFVYSLEFGYRFRTIKVDKILVDRIEPTVSSIYSCSHWCLKNK